jgi:hypothetical protein
LQPNETRHSFWESSSVEKSQQSQKWNSSSGHARKCSICRRADLKDIEKAYLRWGNSENILCEFRLGHHSTTYRHAHATGLAIKRKAHLYTALEYIIEKAQSVKPTANGEQ